MRHRVELKVNGDHYVREIEPKRALLDFLREDLALHGTKKGCETGDCGACSVVVDGKLVCSCLMLAVEAKGAEVTTVEGLATPQGLHPVQEAFAEKGGFQCGYCTPGMVMASYALLNENPDATLEEIKVGLMGNLCRCTGYVKIVDAVQAAAQKMKSGGVAASAQS